MFAIKNKHFVFVHEMMNEYVNKTRTLQKRIEGIHLLLLFTFLYLLLHCLVLSVVFLLALVRDHIAVGPKGREDVVGSFYEQNQ